MTAEQLKKEINEAIASGMAEYIQKEEREAADILRALPSRVRTAVADGRSSVIVMTLRPKHTKDYQKLKSKDPVSALKGVSLRVWERCHNAGLTVRVGQDPTDSSTGFALYISW